jgi:hypothetical protein
MAFRWMRSTARTLPIIISNIKAKASTTFTYGQSLILVTGRWETAVAGAKVAGIYSGPTFTSGADDFIDVIECTPNDVFEVDYTGTPDATFLPGMQTADIAASALVLDAADVTGGAWALLSVDTTNTKATVRAKLRQLS